MDRRQGAGPLRASSLLLLVLAAVLAGCGAPVATPEPIYLEAAGSPVLAPLVGELAAAFSQQNPNISLDVGGLGTQHGLTALREGRADMALASWLPADLEPSYRATAIARDGLAIVVHADNRIDGLGLVQLQELFAGKTYQWQALNGAATAGEIQTVSREDGSGTRAAFEALVMGDQRITPLAVMVASPQAVVDYVAGHPAAIGYVSMSQVTPEVKVLKIEGELPTPESAGLGSYVLTRELWLVTAEPTPEAVQAFLDFVLSPAGQQIVGRAFGRIR